MSIWAYEEVMTSDLGDHRLDVRLATLLDQLGQHPQLSIPAACGGWAETMAAYRFFDNEKTTFETILAPHRDAVIERMKASSVVLLAQDTTEDDENVCLGPKGIGTLKKFEKRSCRLHPTIAFTPSKICLGVVKATYWARDTPSPRRERKHKGIDEKESCRWIESYQDSCALQAQMPDTLVVNLADREGDIYEWFAEYEDHTLEVRAQWIVRAAQNRCLLSGEDDKTKLWDVLEQATILGHADVEVKPRPNHLGRMAHVTLRAASVELKPPARVGYRLPELTVNAVLVREETAPQGVDPLEWLLLTSLPIGSFEQVTTIVEWYGVRWCIEVYFHVLKSGCQIKRLHLETEARLLPCLALYMIIAWRVLFTLMLGRACPEMDCEIVFDPQEWRAINVVVKHCPPPSTPPQLGEMIILVASLGGYLGRKHDGPPGPKAIWIGLQRLRDFVIALEAQEFIVKRCV